MLKKITDLWPALLRGNDEDEDEDKERLLKNEDGDDDKDEGIEVDDQQLLEDYHHLYWSRLVTVHSFEVDLMRMW